ncbi:WD repeat and coiled-coil-containing protein-like isoform X1 [Mytilus galloprovincialis]|uniref:WD repeat and coiled-coil-containing protein-like isoform X1 n=1 Tax=Mytilus galloprovincialis TaxID=29158 RepID=UPI003F7C6629
MELGRVSVRGQNVNLLYEAIHRQHGLVWSIGKTIQLENISLLDGQVENNSPLKLGEFQHDVLSVHWSSNIGPSTCYLSVVHSQHVSLWKVDGVVPKLNFKQVRKLNVQPIPQGCLWNPDRDILCVLAKQQCSFFFHHTDDKGTFAFSPLEDEKIRCGTWTDDGNKLVLCIGACLLLYSWPDIDDTISDYKSAVWRIPNLDGCVTSIVSLSDSIVLCAAELPLESLCKVKDTFVVPDLNENTNSLQEDIISPKKSVSATEALFSLSRNPHFDIESTTQLVTVSLEDEKDPCSISMTGIKGILTPELLVYIPNIKSVVVGSNTQNLLQVFTFQNGSITSALTKTAEVKLDKQERPKGISQMLPPLTNQTGILLAVGRRASSDSAFLTSSSGSAMEIKLKFFPFTIDKNVLKNLKEEQGSLEFKESESSISVIEHAEKVSDTVDIPENIKEAVAHGNQTEKHSENDSSDNYDRDLLIRKQETVTELKDFSKTDSTDSSPRDIILGSQSKGGKSLVEDLTGSGNSGSELETETTEFSAKTPYFQNNIDTSFHDSITDQLIKPVNDQHDVEEKPVHRPKVITCLDDSAISMATSSTSFGTNVDSTKEERMQLEIDKLNHRIEELKMKVSHLTELIKESTIITKYQSQSQPEVIQIHCKCPGMETKKKSFLLDNGRLQYEIVKTAFQLTTLEIFIDDDPCVVSANIDGYIPIRFTPSSTLVITGNTDRGDNTAK